MQDIMGEGKRGKCSLKKTKFQIITLFILTAIFVGLSPLYGSLTIQTEAELTKMRTSNYEMETGFPFAFYHQSIPNTDPPLPYKFGFSPWDFRSFDIIKYILSVTSVFVVVLIIRFIIESLIKRKQLQ